LERYIFENSCGKFREGVYLVGYVEGWGYIKRPAKEICRFFCRVRKKRRKTELSLNGTEFLAGVCMVTVEVYFRETL